MNHFLRPVSHACGTTRVRSCFALFLFFLTRLGTVLAVVLLTGLVTFAQSIKYSSPIKITKGGTYTGNWESLDTSVPAISVETTQPVIIENSNIRSAGVLIYNKTGSNLTIRNCRGVGLLPSVDGASHGRFVNSRKPVNLVIENNFFENTSGIYVHEFIGKGSADQTIRIRFNKARNINGKHRDGINRARVQFVQLNQVIRAANMEIAWNDVLNEPGTSAVEDNMNFYNSSGTSVSPLLIHNNFIKGAYPVNPMATSFSGGGILTDGKGTGDTATAYVQAYQNVVLNTTNYGMGIAAGNNVQYYNNRVISSGLFADGTRIPAQFSGIWMRNYYNAKERDWHSNANRESILAWVKFGYKLEGQYPDRHDISNNRCENCPGNFSLPNPVLLDLEQQEYLDWQQRCREANVTVGLLTPNQAPTVSLTGPAEGTNYKHGTSILLSATAADADGSVKRVEFFRGSLKIGESTTAPYSLTWSSAPVGTHILTAVATDNDWGTAASAALTVTVVPNQPPVANAGEDVTLMLPTNSLTLHGSATDPDGSVVSYLWTQVSGLAATLSGTNTPSLSVSDLAEGEYAFRLTATDDNSATASDDVLVTVVPRVNQAPTVTLTAPAPNSTHVEGTPITLTASATDTDGQVMNVSFYQGDTKIGESTTAPYSVTWSGAAAGTYTLTAVAADNDAASTTSDPITVKVVANQPPVVNAGEDQTITLPTNTLTLNGSASDPDGSVSTYLWTKQSGPAATMSGTNTLTLSLSDLTEGTYVFRLTATDNLSASAFDEATVTVAPQPTNQAPVVSLTAPAENSTHNQGSTITVTASASDPDGSISGVSFFAGTTRLGESTGPTYSISWNEAPVGTHTLTAVATDNAGAQTASAPVTINVVASTSWETGTILREYWANAPGAKVSDIPLSKTPTSTSQPQIFEGPTNIANSYATRFRGYVHPPQTGDYVFWIAGDDHCELWLSTDEDPGKKVRIAYHQGQTKPREWTKFGTQQSAKVALEAGKRYYVEALHKEDKANDNIAVGWQLPNDKQERPIPGSRLSPFILTSTLSASSTKTMVSEGDLAGLNGEAAGKATVYPNPSFDQITLLSPVAPDSPTAITLTNITGQEVFRVLVPAGPAEINLPLNLKELALPQGIYLLRVQTGARTEVLRVIKGQ